MKIDKHGDPYMTRQEIQESIDKYCQEELKVSSVEAYRMLDMGELHGTWVADILKGMRTILETAKD